MKRIFSLLTVVIILASQIVYAENTPISEECFEVCSLGIIVGDENGDLNLDKKVTRAEFAASITRLIAFDVLGGMAERAATRFSDVSINDWFAPYVEVLYTLGIMNGVSENEFAPNEFVTYEQAMKTVVNVLGYESSAINRGGYPEGYISVGTSLRLNKNVAMNEGFDRGSLINLLYNALGVPVVTSFGERTISLREMFTGGTNSVYREHGIVTATYETYLNAPNKDIEKDEVEIDDITYRIADNNFSQYLGQMVEFYVVRDDDGKNNIISMRALPINEVTQIKRSDVKSISLDEIKYFENDSKRTINIQNSKIIKNGRLIPIPQVSDIESDRGIIRVVDNDSDNRAEYVFIEDYVNLRVKSAKGNLIELFPGFSFNGSRYITLDPDNDALQFYIHDSEGNSLSVDDIKSDSTLSISASDNSSLLRITVSENTVNGIVQSLGEEEAELNGKIYPIYENDTLGLEVGMNVTLFLDYMGNIAFFEEDVSTDSYAYLLSAEKHRGISSNIELTMVIGSNVRFETEENDDDLDNITSLPVLHCANQAVTIFETADNIKVDDVKVKGNLSLLSPGLYKYTLNSDGKIKSLTTAYQDCGAKNMKYNPYDKVFWQSSSVPVPIDAETKIICLPKQNTVGGESDNDYAERLLQTSEDDYLVPLKISNKESTVSFDVFGYDMNLQTKKVSAIVFYETMNAQDVLKVNTDSSPIAMVGNSRFVLDEDDEFVKSISLVTNTETVDYLIAEGASSVVQNLKEGDLIYYEVGLSGKIDDARVIYSFSEGADGFAKNSGTANYQICGNIVDMESDVAEVTSGNLTTIVRVNTPKGVIEAPVYQRNTPSVFIYDSEMKTVTKGAISDFMPSDDEMFFALIPMGQNGTACVIYR